MNVVVRVSLKSSRNINAYAVQTSKIGKMQLLVLFDRFKCEESESALPLCVLVDYNILHPTVGCTTVIL